MLRGLVRSLVLRPNFNLLTGLQLSTASIETATPEPDALIRRLEVEVKGHDRAVIDSYDRFIRKVCNELDLNLITVSTPPVAKDRRTVLKSAHIYKIHRVQYEMRTYFRVFELKHMTGSTADTFLEYIQRNLPEGMAMKVTKTRIEALPEHFKKPPDFAKSWTVEPTYEDGNMEHFPTATSPSNQTS